MGELSLKEGVQIRIGHSGENNIEMVPFCSLISSTDTMSPCM